MKKVYSHDKVKIYKGKFDFYVTLDLVDKIIYSSHCIENIDDNFWNNLTIFLNNNYSFENYPEDKKMEDILYKLNDFKDEKLLEYKYHNKKFKIKDYDTQKFFNGQEVDLCLILKESFYNKKIPNEYFKTIDHKLIQSNLTGNFFQVLTKQEEDEKDWKIEYIVTNWKNKKEYNYFFVPIKYYIMHDLKNEHNYTIEELIDLFKLELFLVERSLKECVTSQNKDTIEVLNLLK